MKVLVLISLVGGLMLSSCGGSSSKNNANVKEVNPADTIYLGDLREKFANDSVFFKNSGTGFDVDGLSVSLGSNRIGSSRERTDKKNTINV
mgnify:CR=1 FL=1